MTSPTSGRLTDLRLPMAGRRMMHRSHGGRAVGNGFTLIEILVVVGIIAILASILLVGVNLLNRQGGRIAGAADLQAVAAALEAYRNDFNDYPRVYANNTGAAILCRALLGPAIDDNNVPTSTGNTRGKFAKIPSGDPQNPFRYFIALADNTTGPTMASGLPQDDWAPFGIGDGAPEGYGIRAGPRTIDDDGDGVPDRPGGRVYGPYLQPEKFKVEQDACMLLDGNGNPILYFPASAAKPNLSQPGAYIGGNQAALFNVNHNMRFFMRKAPVGNETTDTSNARDRIRAMLGDYGLDGALNKQPAMETETSQASTVPFLLWTAGPDGLFGPPVDPATNKNAIQTNPADLAAWKNNQSAVDACDDITNFR